MRWFGTDKIIRASATPNEDPSAIHVDVPEEDVIAEGLIKKVIHVNPGFPMQIDLDGGEGGKTRYLLEKALAKRTELAMAFQRAGSAVNPLILVQLPNSSDALLDTVEEWFAERHIDVAGGTFAVWLANRKDNVEGLTKNDAPQVAVVIKQAVATGWDCPRAHILVKLRENMDERFEIQTIGRVRRMPEARHYGNDVLDGCYLFTFDERFTAGVIGSASDKDVGVEKVFIKGKYKAFSLVKEQRTSVAETRDAAVALSSVSEWFHKEYGLGRDFGKNRMKLETAGYVFGERIVATTLSGDAATTSQMKSANRTMNTVEVGEAVSTHRHGRDFHHSIGVIGEANALPYDDARTILYRVFGTNPTDVAKCLRLEPAAMYAFVINNEKRLRDDFIKALSVALKLTTSGNKTVEKEFRFPHEYLCSYSKTAKNQNASAKNVYDGYPMSAMTAKTRSSGEMKFEKWCESERRVEWVYRNGDKGEEFFSLVYEDNSEHQRLFFPDYVICAGGQTWIIEVKGGWNASGASENIDPYVEKKAHALKAYCAKHGVHGAFVGHDEGEDILMATEDGYSEDCNAPCWRPISEVLFPHGRASVRGRKVDLTGESESDDGGISADEGDAARYLAADENADE